MPDEADSKVLEATSVPQRVRICPECGGSRLMRDYEVAEIVCMGCGCVIAEKLADTRPEWRAFDDEQKTKRARAGAPLTFSVDFDEPIIVSDGRRVRAVKIGEFVESQLTKSRVRKLGNIEYARFEGCRALSFDRNYSMDFRPIQYVARHQLSDDLCEIALSDRGAVKVTAAHSLFKFEDGEVVAVEASTLQEGDLILGIRCPQVLQLLESKVSCRYKPASTYKVVRRDRKVSSHVAYLLKCLIEAVESEIKQKLKLPSRIVMSEDLCRLLGYFASNGTMGCEREIEVLNDDCDSAKELQVLLRNVFGVRSAVVGNGRSIQVEISCNLLAKMLADITRFPEPRGDQGNGTITYDLPANLKFAFLQGYSNGNGSSRNCCEPRLPPFNKKSTGTLVLLEDDWWGTPCRTCRKRDLANGFTNEMLTEEQVIHFIKRQKGPIAHDRAVKQDYAEKGSGAFDVATLYSAGFELLKVSHVRRVRPTRQYAYDISVPACENFVGGRLGVFFHNTIHDKGLSTVIDWRDRHTSGRKLSPTQRMDLYRLRKWQRRVRVSDATERNLAAALSELSKLASFLNLPKNILETASVIYRKAIKKRLIRGRSVHNVTAAAIYMSCRQCGVPRTLEEIADASNSNKKDVGRSYRFMVRELEMFVPPSTSRHYAARFSNKLTISGKAEAISIRILETAQSMKLTSGRGPTGIAAASTYIATVLTNERKTQREIAEIANVTEVTIRNRYKELLDRLSIDVLL